MVEYFKGVGTVLMVVGLFFLGVACIYYLLVMIDKIITYKKQKANETKTKVEGDTIKVRFVIDKQVTVFNYNTKNKKITVKGKEKDVVNGIKAILAADDTVYFAVEETGKLYQLKNEKMYDVFAKDEFVEDDEEDWD